MSMDFNGIFLNNFKIIGEGSGRVVYDLENGYVLKMAKNKKGFVQNRAEYELSSDENTQLFARVTDYSNDFKYIVMEKADKLKNFNPIFHYYKVKNKKQLNNTNDMQYIISKYHLNTADLGAITSWGSINGVPKVIDYGLTHQIFMKYYFKERLYKVALVMLLIKD